MVISFRFLLYKDPKEIQARQGQLVLVEYKVRKYTEGVLSDAEWEEAKANRAAWR